MYQKCDVSEPIYLILHNILIFESFDSHGREDLTQPSLDDVGHLAIHQYVQQYSSDTNKK